MRQSILGIPIDAVTMEQAVKFVTDAIEAGRRGIFVTTPNPEMLVLAQEHPEFRDALWQADLNVPDGRGLLWAAQTLGGRLLERVPGVELMDKLLAWAEAKGRRVFLLGGIEPDTAERAAAGIKQKYPRINLVGAISSGAVRRDLTGHRWVEGRAMAAVRDAKPELLFVAFGQMKQEEWIAYHLPRLPMVTMAMGVGGSFDFFAGRFQRAPRWVRRLGLEWLWRFMQEPKRWRRTARAVVKFPWLVLKAKQQQKRERKC